MLGFNKAWAEICSKHTQWKRGRLWVWKSLLSLLCHSPDDCGPCLCSWESEAPEFKFWCVWPGGWGTGKPGQIHLHIQAARSPFWKDFQTDHPLEYLSKLTCSLFFHWISLVPSPDCLLWTIDSTQGNTVFFSSSSLHIPGFNFNKTVSCLVQLN